MKTFRRFERLKALGLCPFPNQATCEAFPSILKGDVSKYVKAEAELRKELTHEHRVAQKKRDRMGTTATFRSRGARRVSLHSGRQPPFAAAREELHGMYRAKRTRGERVTASWLRISMKRLGAQVLRRRCGGWLQSDEMVGSRLCARVWHLAAAQE